MKKKYKVTFDVFTDVVFEIDHSVFTDNLLNECNDFWMDSESRKDENGSPLHGWLKMVARNILVLQVEYGGMQESWLIDKFKRYEGYPPLDGSMGIKLIQADEFSFEDHDMEVKEI